MFCRTALCSKRSARLTQDLHPAVACRLSLPVGDMEDLLK